MEPSLFFEVVDRAIRSSTRRETAAIQVRVAGVEEQVWTIRLGDRPGVLKGGNEGANLIIWCDAQQLEELLTAGVTQRALRISGDERLLPRLEQALQPAQGWLGVRVGASRGFER